MFNRVSDQYKYIVERIAKRKTQTWVAEAPLAGVLLPPVPPPPVPPPPDPPPPVHHLLVLVVLVALAEASSLGCWL